MPKPPHKPEARSGARRDTRRDNRRDVQRDTRPEARPAAGQRKASALASVLSALSPRALFNAVFVDQLRLRLDGPRLKIALESPAPPEPDTPPVAAADPPAVQMQRALSQLLDSRADSRSVLKHLTALEHLLKHSEGPFIHDLSLSALQHMLRQLQGLFAPPPSPALALLLAELLDAAELKTHREAEAAEARSHPISSFFVDHKLEVKELSPSTLDLPGEVEPAGAERGTAP